MHVEKEKHPLQFGRCGVDVESLVAEKQPALD